jgi:regulator of sigma E protease
VAIDGQPVLSFAATSGILSSTPATEHVLTVRRGEERLDFTVKPALARRGDEERLLVGITWGVNRSARVLVHENPLKQVWDALEMTFGGLWALVNPRSDVGLGNMNGPVGIVHAFVLTVEEGLALVLFLTLLINVNLAIVNLLPIPVLDGGQVLFATIEKLRRNAIPIRTLVATQNAFMLLILCLFFYISFNDIGASSDRTALSLAPGSSSRNSRRTEHGAKHGRSSVQRKRRGGGALHRLAPRRPPPPHMRSARR